MDKKWYQSTRQAQEKQSSSELPYLSIIMLFWITLLLPCGLLPKHSYIIVVCKDEVSFDWGFSLLLVVYSNNLSAFFSGSSHMTEIITSVVMSRWLKRRRQPCHGQLKSWVIWAPSLPAQKSLLTVYIHTSKVTVMLPTSTRRLSKCTCRAGWCRACLQQIVGNISFSARWCQKWPRKLDILSGS